MSAVCLFCEKQAETIEKLCVHMEVRYFDSFDIRQGEVDDYGNLIILYLCLLIIFPFLKVL